VREVRDGLAHWPTRQMNWSVSKYQSLYAGAVGHIGTFRESESLVATPSHTADRPIGTASAIPVGRAGMQC
jgi:hypothetical protein